MKEDISDLRDDINNDIDVNINSNLSVDRYEIISRVSDFNVATIISYIEEGAVIIPEYQRNYLWSLSEASKLVESLILNLPIPPLFLFIDKNYDFYLIDGQQRLMSIYFFFKNKFPKKDKYGITLQSNRLRNLMKKDELFDEFQLALINVDNSESKYNNKTLKDIDEKLFLLQSVRTIIIETKNSSYSEKVALEMFNRFNQSIKELKPAEKRFARYYSKSYQRLCDFNETNKQWRDFLSNTELKSQYPTIEQVDILLDLFGAFMYFICDNKAYSVANTWNLSKTAMLLSESNDSDIDTFLEKLSKFIELCVTLQAEKSNAMMYYRLLLSGLFIAMIRHSNIKLAISDIERLHEIKVSDLFAVETAISAVEKMLFGGNDV